MDPPSASSSPAQMRAAVAEALVQRKLPAPALQHRCASNYRPDLFWDLKDRAVCIDLLSGKDARLWGRQMYTFGPLLRHKANERFLGILTPNQHKLGLQLPPLEECGTYRLGNTMVALADMARLIADPEDSHPAHRLRAIQEGLGKPLIAFGLNMGPFLSHMKSASGVQLCDAPFEARMDKLAAELRLWMRVSPGEDWYRRAVSAYDQLVPVPAFTDHSRLAWGLEPKAPVAPRRRGRPAKAAPGPPPPATVPPPSAEPPAVPPPSTEPAAVPPEPTEPRGDAPDYEGDGSFLYRPIPPPRAPKPGCFLFEPLNLGGKLMYPEISYAEACLALWGLVLPAGWAIASTAPGRGKERYLPKNIYLLTSEGKWVGPASDLMKREPTNPPEPWADPANVGPAYLVEIWGLKAKPMTIMRTLARMQAEKRARGDFSNLRDVI